MKKKSFLSLLLVLALLLGACGTDEEKKTTDRSSVSDSEDQDPVLEENTDTEADSLGYTGIYESFTDVVVKDEVTALEAVAQAADTLGLSQPQEQLQVASTLEYDGHTYYRMQRYCNGIPVYGKQVVLAAGADGKVVALTASEEVADCAATEPTLAPQTAGDILSLYFQEVVPAPESLTQEQLCYYPMEDGTVKLGYCLDLSESNFPYRVILDAVDGTVLHCESLIDGVDCYNADGTVKFNGFADYTGTFYMCDKVNGIIVYTMNGIPSEIKTSNGQKISQLSLAQALASSDNRFGNTEEEAELEMEKGITLLQNLITIKGFFREQYHAPEYPMVNIVYNDGFNNGTNGYATIGCDPEASTVDEMYNGIIAIGSAQNVSSIEMLGHEYTHLVESKVVGTQIGDKRQGGMLYQGESGSVAEAYSDVFGEILEDYTNDGQLDNDCDWIHHLADGETRNMVYPLLSLLPTSYGDVAWCNPNSSVDNGYVHHNSTVLSHAAYLMNKGTGGESIGTETLGRLWMNTLYLLQADTDMHQMADTMINVAHRMVQQGSLTEGQLDAVYRAFYKVKLLTEQVGTDFDIEILDDSGNPYGNYQLKIVSFPQEENVVNETITEAKPYAVHLTTGQYSIVVTDLSENGSESVYSKVVEVSKKIKKTKTAQILTDFGQMNYRTMYWNYVAEQLIPKYGQAANFRYNSVELGLSDESQREELVTKLPAEAKGICSVYIADFNNDLVSEMVTVRNQDGVIIVELYGIDSNQVVYRDRVKEHTVYQGFDEQMYIYAISHEGQRYLCIGVDGWGTYPVGSSRWGVSFEAFYVDAVGHIQTKHSLSYRHQPYGNVAYEYNDVQHILPWFSEEDDNESAIIQEQLDRIEQDAFRSIGVPELAEGWVCFPENASVDRIYSGGTEPQINKDSWGGNTLVLSTDYTGTAKDAPVSQYGNIVDYGTFDATTWILYEGGTLLLGSTWDYLDFVAWYYDWEYNWEKVGQIRKVVFDDSINEIEYLGLEDYTNLISASIPAGVTKITTGIYSGWLWDASDLVRIWVDPANTAFSSDRRGCLYNKDQTTLLRVPPAITGTYRVPEGVTTIGEGAFANCVDLSEIIIPASVIKIADDAFSNYRGKVVMEGESSIYSNDSQGVLFGDDQKVLVHAPSTISGHYNIPEGTEVIGEQAFYYCELLTGVTIPDTVRKIERNAFWGCKKLTKITIPSGVKYIGQGALDEDCLLEIYYQGNQLQWENINDDFFGKPEVLSCFQGKITAETASLYARYSETVKQYEAKYGKIGMINTGYETMVGGVCYLNMLDFDGDGKEELIVVYSEGSTTEDFRYKMDILTDTTFGPECIYTKILEWSEQWSGCNEWIPVSGDTYLIRNRVTSYNDQYGCGYLESSYYGMKNGVFTLIQTILEPSEDDGDFYADPDWPVWVGDVCYTYQEYMDRHDELRGFDIEYQLSYSVGRCDSTEKYEDNLQLVKNILAGA